MFRGVIIVCAIAISGTAWAATADDNAKQVLDGSYQDVPGDEPMPPMGGSGQMGGGGNGNGNGNGNGPRNHDGRYSDSGGGGGGGGGGGSPSIGGPGGALGTILSWLVWGALGVGLVLLIVFIVREIGRRKKDEVVDAEEATATEEPLPAEAQLAAPLDDAEELARAGKFAEAIHVLLLRTFEELARADGRVPPHLTSREILTRIRLRDGARDALSDLALTVEVTWFGDDVPGEPDWQRCRSSWHAFAAAYREAAA